MADSGRQSPKPKPWEQDLEGSGGSFGGWLRRQRELREISLREIAETSKISLRYLEALEQDRFELLPAPVFARGFLREYAKFVGLDADEVVNFYLAAQQSPEPESEGEEPPERPRSGRHWTQALWLAAAVVLLFGLISGLSFWAEQRSRSGRSAPAMAAPPPAAPELPAAPPTPTTEVSPLRVTLDFTQNCWVEAFVDGERRVSELRVQGESLQIEAESEVRLSLNNVAGVSVEVNGAPYSLDSEDEEPFTIDLETARALRASS